MLCSPCRHGLSGLDGHTDIILAHQGSSDTDTVFCCANCAQQYKRLYGGSGVFVWLTAEAPAPAERT